MRPVIRGKNLTKDEALVRLMDELRKGENCVESYSQKETEYVLCIVAKTGEGGSYGKGERVAESPCSARNI